MLNHDEMEAQVFIQNLIKATVLNMSKALQDHLEEDGGGTITNLTQENALSLKIRFILNLKIEIKSTKFCSRLNLIICYDIA